MSKFEELSVQCAENQADSLIFRWQPSCTDGLTCGIELCGCSEVTLDYSGMIRLRDELNKAIADADKTMEARDE